jgi:hypothetical protein
MPSISYEVQQAGGKVVPSKPSVQGKEVTVLHIELETVIVLELFAVSWSLATIAITAIV